MDEKDLKIQEQRAEIKRLGKLLAVAKTFIPRECEFCIHEPTDRDCPPCSACTLDNDHFEWDGECCLNDV